MNKLLKKLNNKGDTIVEVLIAIAVVSSVLGIAYSIMNRNLQITRDNQERTEASKLAQSQLEMLRIAWEENSQELTNNGSGSFCMDSSSATSGITDVEDFATYGTCAFGIYHRSIRLNSSGGYTVTVKWGALGGGRSEIVMAYKAEQ